MSPGSCMAPPKLRVNDGFGSLAGILECAANVRFTPKSSHQAVITERPQSAVNDRVHSARAEDEPSIIRLYLGYVRRIDHPQQASKDVIDLEPSRHALGMDFKQGREALVANSDE